MIEAIRQWATILAGVLVFGSLSLVLLPEGKFHRPIRMTLGLLLTLALLKPVQGWREESIPDMEHFQRNQTDRREEIEGKQKGQVAHLFRQKLESQMKETLRQEGWETVKAVQCPIEEEDQEHFGKIKEVLVLVEDVSRADSIKEFLQKEYEVPREKVTVACQNAENG